jgi:hypothetical protein
MKTERMPWTCRWSEFRPATPTPMWVDEWMSQWTCLVDGRRETASAIDRCADCQKFDTRDDRAGQPSREREI